MFTNLITIAGLAGLAWALVHVTRLVLRNRTAKSFDAAAHGLVPRDQLDSRLPGPPREGDSAVRVAAEAAWAGEWEAVAGLLADAGEDWDARWRLIEVFAAVEDGTWLRVWRMQRPQDADAVVVHAHALLIRAWAARGVEYSHKTSGAQMATFAELLPAAMDAAREAAGLAPRDPSPWVTMVAAARGMGVSHEEFRRLWGELTARAPQHYEGHLFRVRRPRRSRRG